MTEEHFALLAVCVLVVSAAGGTVLADGVEKDVSSHKETHYSDFFENETIHHDDAVNFTNYKHVTSNSPYVYADGSWVTLHNDNYQKGGLYDSNYYWAASRNNRVEISQYNTEDSASTLELITTYTYDDDDSSDIPPGTEDAFNYAWSLASTYAPFPIPPKPPGLLETTSGEVTVDAKSSYTKVYKFNEGQTQSGEQYTHGAHWKWEFPYGADAGWYFTWADRRATHGYIIQDENGYETFQEEDKWEFALDTSFCIYRDSKSQEC